MLRPTLFMAVLICATAVDASAAPLPGETPPVPNAIFIHGKDIKQLTVFGWERNGTFSNSFEGDGKEVPYDAAKVKLRRFTFPGGQFRQIFYAKDTHVHPHATNAEDTIAYTVSGRRVQIVNEQAQQVDAGDISFYPAGSVHHGDALRDSVNVEIAFDHANMPAEEGVWIHNKDLPETPIAAWAVGGKRMMAGGPDAAKAPADAGRYTAKVFKLPRYTVYEAHLPKGAKIAPATLTSKTDGIVYMVKGKLRVTVGKTVDTVEGGDAFRQATGQLYGAEALEDTVYIAVDLPVEPAKAK